MFNTLSIYGKDILHLLFRAQSGLSRYKVLFAYLKICFVRSVLIRVVKNKKKISFFGFTVFFVDFNDFFWTFRELFVHEDYYFKSTIQSPIIFDGGGNIGMSVFYFKALYPGAHITVFEPHPENSSILKKNIDYNQLQHVTVLEQALGGHNGTLEIFGNKRAATLHKQFQVEQAEATVRTSDEVHTVSVAKLSSFIGDTDVTFLKLDIEGAETDVIEDLAVTGVLQRVHHITMEFHHFDFQQNRLSKIIARLEDAGFSIVFFSDRFNQYQLPKKKYYHFMVTATRQ